MSQYWSRVVHALTPYEPGEQPKVPNLIKLNTNENPYGPSALALDALRRELGDTLRLYPDPNSDRLKEAIASSYCARGISTRQVFVGNGSDEVLALAFLALLRHDTPILFPDVTYSFYPVYCGLFGIEYRLVALDERFQIRPEDYSAPNGGIVFPNPNAPTGCFLPLPDVERIVEANPASVVVVDEAYADFGADSALTFIARHRNLLVVRTLSKSHSLAGLRVGYAVGDAELVEGLERVKNSFNSYPLDRLAVAGAVAAIADEEHFERTRRAVIASREALARDLSSLGFEVLPSKANFVFARHGARDAEAIARALRQRGIIVRHFRQPRIRQFLRISVGTDEQCEALVRALREILS
jgi:histidinol-phosphate aminotransferase